MYHIFVFFYYFDVNTCKQSRETWTIIDFIVKQVKVY